MVIELFIWVVNKLAKRVKASQFYKVRRRRYRKFKRNLKKRLYPVRRRLILGAALVALGLAIGAASLIITLRAEHSAVDPAHSTHALKNNVVKKSQTPLVAGVPVHISIPSVSIDLNVIPGYYNPDDQSWTLSLDNAQYGTMTAKANNKEGDTFIYAHYRWGVFYNLPKILPGAQAIITTDNGHSFTYTFTTSTITSPSDTSLFTYKGKPILVLQTCTGLWYQDRQLFTFELTAYS